MCARRNGHGNGARADARIGPPAETGKRGGGKPPPKRGEGKPPPYLTKGRERPIISMKRALRQAASPVK